MTTKDEIDLKSEIQHIFDSGANELRIFEMIKAFIDRRYETPNIEKSSIDFAEYCVMSGYQYYFNGEYWIWGNPITQEYLTTDKLYEKYIKYIKTR